MNRSFVIAVAVCCFGMMTAAPTNLYAVKVDVKAEASQTAESRSAEEAPPSAEEESPSAQKTDKKAKARSRKAEKMIRLAEAEIGTSTPARKERTKYEKEIFGSNGHLWCASFVSWCAVKAGISSRRIPRSMSTLTMAERAKKYYHPWNKKTWGSLRRGDVIFFSPRKAKLRYAGGGKAVHHVGIVQRVDRENKLLYTVEGNVSRITRKGKIDLTRRVVRACVYRMKPKTGKILASEAWFFDGEYICGTITVK